ncbi:2-amino-4-hydroxy-6-hydroxymethyldihydropteridine diphosphokinase [Mycetocola tolaasinivorans]|uniref:2-amino-4-hydroxy-6-hydroxymethyldihydropteridine diphosphokinase n=1 Tax=Mycetocola tolaasinivorans TaxID=76635 RepID=A0A3L6ZW87_9MICO|nr:2-amino-4-hydroxy-6-hydroxymethyldihydropteridine diphosphokinase [Mycetocola tolaasinivorans]RLP71841.1 2-amino-4-hydroxy-6-hydroxymethyldihydropteridine diphosphokinase [Mycetocola tolaasinivorans]
MNPLPRPRVTPPSRNAQARLERLAADEEAAGRAPKTPVSVVLALGANLGARAETLEAAVRELGEHSGIDDVSLSPVINSVAVKLNGPDPEAPGYLNAVATLSTTLSPRDLLAVGAEIERAHGRERLERWGDRTLDIDIITYGDLAIDTPALTIPHPRAAERDFVLGPWHELDAQAFLPGYGSVAELLAELRATQGPASETGTP